MRKSFIASVGAGAAAAAIGFGVVMPAAAGSTAASSRAPAAAHRVGATAAATTCQRTLAAYPILRPGDTGTAVRTLQCTMNDAGLGPVVVDGWYGPQSKRVVVAVAAGTEGVPDTSGRVNNSMWVRLISGALSDRTLRTGSTGSDVLVLQRALRAQGFAITVDGRFGPQTASVVRAFQRATGNVPDGVVGPATLFALHSGGSARLAN
jgi:peptidoglycan hydrolase-like protein with peptidoglycan-binding domain